MINERRNSVSEFGAEEKKKKEKKIVIINKRRSLMFHCVRAFECNQNQL